MEWILILFLGVLNIPVYRFIYKFIFPRDEDFRESIRYSFTPDLFSLFRGEYWRDRIGEFKLGMFIFCCIAAVALEFFVIRWLLHFIVYKTQ